MDNIRIINSVLLVEDEPVSQIIFKALMSIFGYEVSVASNAKMAIEFLNQGPYSLIFMDLGLPDRPGLEVVQEIRAQLHLKTPIIALTAYGADIKKQACLDAGCNFFMEKPITKKKFKSLLLELSCF